MTNATLEGDAAHGQDNDLLICELQHRVDELLADNDSLQERLWALNIAIVSMAEKIAELEDVT